MSIDDLGFLSPDIKHYASKIYAEHTELFAFCSTANVAAHMLKNRLQIPVDDRRKTLSACLYTRIINGFQASILLCIHGMPVEAAVIVRTMYESYNYLKRLCEDEAFLEKYLRDGALVAQKEIRYLLEKRPYQLSSDEEARLKSNLEELERMQISNKDDIRINDLGATTYSIYKVLSRTAHPKAYGLEETYMVTDSETGNITLDWGPHDRNLGLILITAHDVLMPSMWCLATLFEFDISDVIRQLHESFEGVRNKEFGNSQ